jgi:DNA replication protein DnaC
MVTRKRKKKEKEESNLTPPTPEEAGGPLGRLRVTADEKIKVCPQCGGSGWVVELRHNIRYAERCQCWTNNLNSLLLAQANIPKQYADCTLKSFNPSADPSGSLYKALQTAREFCDEFPITSSGLLFIGPCGVGKTHLAVSIIRHLTLEKGVPCRFYDFRDLLRTIRRTYSNEGGPSEFDITDPVLTTEVVLLDELGAIKATDWALDMLTHIIIRRYNEKRPLIITSNFPDEKGKNNEETLSDRISYRLRSRLYEMCQTVRMEGGDFRRTKVW